MQLTFIDLGLPSGTLWAKTPLSGSYSHSQAKKLPPVYDPACHLPSFEELKELIDNCECEADPHFDSAEAVDFMEEIHYCESRYITGPKGTDIEVPIPYNHDGYMTFWSKDNALGDDRKPLEDCKEALFFGFSINRNVLFYDAAEKDNEMYVLLCKSK